MGLELTTNESTEWEFGALTNRALSLWWWGWKIHQLLISVEIGTRMAHFTTAAMWGWKIHQFSIPVEIGTCPVPGSHPVSPEQYQVTVSWGEIQPRRKREGRMKSGFSYRLLYVISSPRLFSLLFFQLILNYWFMRFRFFFFFLLFSFFFYLPPPLWSNFQSGLSGSKRSDDSLWRFCCIRDPGSFFVVLWHVEVDTLYGRTGFLWIFCCLSGCATDAVWKCIFLAVWK